MVKNELVVLKGCGGGINMILDDSAPINDIMEVIRKKIRESGGFFKGECNIFISGRALSKSDELRIASVMQTVFPEANIVFQKESEEPVVEEITSRNHTDKGARFVKELIQAAEFSKGMLKKDRSGTLKPQKIDVRMYNGNINSGESLVTQGDILIVGNVEKGSLVSAEGDIYVMGNLFGRAVAGSKGNEKCRIFAASFCPESVTIAGVSMEFDKFAQESVPKMTYLMNRVIVVEKIL